MKSPIKQAQAGLGDRLHFLHVGCGNAKRNRLPTLFHDRLWHEIRLDLDPSVQPDVVASIVDLSMIPDASMDAIWSSHNLEHLHAFEVPIALAEFVRVLKPTGFALITLPDMRAVARYIVNDQLELPLYHSAVGPIAPIDIVFGHQASIATGNIFMAHKTGFTASTLARQLSEAGFAEARVHEGNHWDLWALATMPDTDPAVFGQLAGVAN